MNTEGGHNARVKYRKWPALVASSVKCGYLPKNMRNWRELSIDQMTRAERNMQFCEFFLKVPEGVFVGKPIRLEAFQEAFFYSVFDNPAVTRRAILSLGRKNSKTATSAMILLCFIVGPEAKVNMQLSSGAMNKSQAAVVFNLMVGMINQSEAIHSRVHYVQSHKELFGKNKHTRYKALARDGRSTMGRSDRVVLLDEIGQITSSEDAFVSAMISGQGAYDDALQIVISTQAASDAALLSIWIDDAIRTQDQKIALHLYATPEHYELLDEKGWQLANPATFRSKTDLKEQLIQASRLPSMEASARNLLLNQRISQTKLWLAPTPWKACNGQPDHEVFRTSKVAIGLDLSARLDLTAAVISARDDLGIVHTLPFVFCPSEGIEERSKRDRVPYATWVKQGLLIPLGGATMDYRQICVYLRDKFDEMGIVISTVEFDRWGIENFKKEAADVGFCSLAEWNAVGQGYASFSPRCKAFEVLLLGGGLRHGGHPLLNMAASNAVAVLDASGNVKIDKSKSINRIDPLVALVMSTYAVTEGSVEALDVSNWIV
jgi:phage terminase large subunit-like protein